MVHGTQGAEYMAHLAVYDPHVAHAAWDFFTE